MGIGTFGPRRVLSKMDVPTATLGCVLQSLQQRSVDQIVIVTESARKALEQQKRPRRYNGTSVDSVIKHE